MRPFTALVARQAAESTGSITLGGRVFDYRVHAAFLPVGADGPDGASAEPEAAIMATAYLQKGVPAAQRPVCFAFNGGPGSASIWLHLGALGPKRVVVPDDASMPQAPFGVQDNPLSWFEHFDLVFIDPPHTGWSVTASEEARKKMLSVDGDIDALVFASAPESPLVQMLLQTPGVRLFDFPQAEAYSRRFAFISPVTLPRGVVDLARDMPPANIRMIAPTATLVARESTHPALIQLFVQAAKQIHSGAGWFNRKGDFPNIVNTERTLAPEAERFYRNGPPLLQRYLPFWIANLVDRMWVVMVSIVAILIPLSRVVPPLYQFRVRSRIFRWYGQLRRLEDSIGEQPANELIAELDQLEKRAEQITVPLSYADELYSLRSHINLVRRRLQPN